MNFIYGYCRISRKTQNIERQVRNILRAYPDAKICKEIYTGTRIQGRRMLDEIIRKAKTGDTIVFDSVSRMSRNAGEGIELYEQLYQNGIELVFLNEPHINTQVFREAMQKQINVNVQTGDEATDTLMHKIIDALNGFQISLARRQIGLAFQQSQKEVDDLHVRTMQGMETARRNGKQIGQKKGAAFRTKKSISAKQTIQRNSRDFNGGLNDKDCMKLAGISNNTYYKYKRELRLQLAEKEATYNYKEETGDTGYGREEQKEPGIH